MNNQQKAEWKMMVQSAELALKSNCPLLEDEVIVEANRRITELEKERDGLKFANTEAKEYIESELGSVFVAVCPSKPFNPKEHQAIRDLEKMALGLKASINFWRSNTSSKMQGHIEYGILGKRPVDDPDTIPIEILERDMNALLSQAKELEQGE